MLSVERLKEFVSYNKKTGEFISIQKIGAREKFGSVGYVNKLGYLRIMIDGQLYHGHRLAWLYVHGYFPETEIDHKNGINNDNRMCNLRVITHTCNMQNRRLNKNNVSGFKGVFPYGERWESQITINKKKVRLGFFEDIISAALARVEAEKCFPEWNCDAQDINRVKLRELGFNV